ncbi:MAG TPA: twin-arginine translocation signal domain-containing protein [Thermoguttaceae bacterium]|nr:twin-arginine translocation signal domain-containing protein [Thermoguttaceae bacterium]
MDRRTFLKTSTGAAAASGIGGVVAVSQGGQTAAPRSDAPAVLSGYTAEEHRRRLENIGRCRGAIRSCMRKHLITGYLPAQCCYNLGEYPARKPWTLGPYDEEELDRLRDQGIQLIQLFDEWADPLRLFGGDKFTPVDPAAVRRFIEMAHERGMKVLPYASTCFLQRTDPDFRQAWSREGDNLEVGYWNMARCSPASPGWRAYLLPRIVRMFDEFGADGIYIDGGYVWNARKRLHTPAEDEVVAFEETPEHDGAFADLLALIYGEVKRRGGVLKVHVSGDQRPQSGELKVYDYLWVGEGVGNAERMREAVKDHPPYVVPCIDMTFATTAGDDEPFLHAIPYMQFPLLQAGKPFTGERASIPGVEYPRGEKDFWVRRCRAIWEHHRAHPDGPHTYGIWDHVPGRPETRSTHTRWLRQYLPMVEEGTRAWLEIGESALFSRPLPPGVVASAFANRGSYLVLANYTEEAVDVPTSDACVDTREPGSRPSRQWRLGGRSLVILRRS